MTGASRGIGHATAMRPATTGYDLMLAGRRVHSPKAQGRLLITDTLENVARGARKSGACTETTALDLLDGEPIDAAVAAALHTFERINVVVHRATNGDRGIPAYNLRPGVVATEVLRASLGNEGPLEQTWGIAEPEVPASVIDWLIAEDRAGEHLKGGVNAQRLFKELDLRCRVSGP